jgi:hypothetical protein
VLQQNLLPGWLGRDRTFRRVSAVRLPPTAVVLAFSTYITWNYTKGGRGVKIYEGILKIMVGVIVACFAGVILRLTFSPGGLDSGATLAGFVPDFTLLGRPADASCRSSKRRTRHAGPIGRA